MRKLLNIMYSKHVYEEEAFTSINEMIETLFIAAFYKISWIVEAVEDCLIELLHPEDPITCRKRPQSRDEKVVQARVVDIF